MDSSTKQTEEKTMFKSKAELLEWHSKGVMTTFTAAVYLVTMYHASPIEIFKVLKLHKLFGIS